MATGSYTTEEGWQPLSDGHEVFTKLWKPTGAPVALLLFIHGFSDHADMYYTLFPSLASRGVQCHAFDQRGWGRSAKTKSQRGLTGSTTTVLSDITTMIQSILPNARSLNVPFFLMGHSMGGAQVLYYAARGPSDVRSQIRGYIAESPLVAIHPSTQPNRLTVFGGRIASKVAPKRQLVSKLNPEWMSRDEQVCKDFSDDQLCHDTGTFEGLAGMLDRSNELEKGLVTPTEGRFWIGHGSEDRVVSYDASKVFFDQLRVQDKEFKTYEGWFHKLHAEPGEDKITFANDVANWIIDKSGKGSEDTRSKL